MSLTLFRSAPLAFQLAGFQAPPQTQQVAGRLRHVDIDRIELLDGRQRRGLNAVTSAPSVTLDLPMRPEMGASPWYSRD